MNETFRRDFARLPKNIQKQARAAYSRFKVDPSLPGLQFKLLHTKFSLWSARINNSYRAVGLRRSDDKIIWFFIGTHAEYERLLSSL